MNNHAEDHVFRARALMRRLFGYGNFFRTITGNAVQAVRIEPNGIVFTQRGHDFHYAWSQIRNVLILKKKISGRMSYTHKRLCIQTTQKTFMINVTGFISELEHDEQLLTLLKQYTKIHSKTVKGNE